jgi:hypothetical protein
MPLMFISALWGALGAAMGSLIGRAVIALSIGFVSYKGIDLGISALKTQAINGVNSLPADALGLVGYLWLDKALTVVFSGVVTALSMKLVGGSLKKMVFK